MLATGTLIPCYKWILFSFFTEPKENLKPVSVTQSTSAIYTYLLTNFARRVRLNFIFDI